MPLIGLARRTRSTQPSGSARINWSNVYTAGLRHAWLTYPPNNYLRCLVTGNIGIVTGAFTAFDAALGLQGTNTAVSFNYIELPLSFTAIPPVTILNVNGVVSGEASWGVTNKAGIGLHGYANVGSSAAYKVSSANGITVDGSILPTPVIAESGTPLYATAMTFRAVNDFAAASGGGAVSNDTTCVAPTGNVTSGCIGSYLAAIYAKAPASVYQHKLFAVWDLASPDATLVELSRNPWQLFE